MIHDFNRSYLQILQADCNFYTAILMLIKNNIVSLCLRSEEFQTCVVLEIVCRPKIAKYTTATL